MKLVKLANFKVAKTHENREVGQLGQAFLMLWWASKPRLCPARSMVSRGD